MEKASVRPTLTQSGYERLLELYGNTQLKNKLEQEYDIEFQQYDFPRIVSSLVRFAEQAFSDEFNIRLEYKSEIEIAKIIDLLLSAIDKQRRYAVYDPRRTGYEYFVLYSQRGFSEAESNARGEALLTGRDPGPPGLCRDSFDNYPDPFGNLAYHSVGQRHGWLESLLREIRDNMGRRPEGLSKRGPKGKRRARYTLFHDLAEIYERSGGTVKAYKNPMTEVIEGDFVRFVGDLAQACPPTVCTYLHEGLGDAIIRWIRSGRPPPKGRIDLMKLLVDGVPRAPGHN